MGKSLASKHKDFETRFGLDFDKPIAPQLKDHTVSDVLLLEWQRCADAIQILHLTGIMDDAREEDMTLRLFLMIKRHIMALIKL